MSHFCLETFLLAYQFELFENQVYLYDYSTKRHEPCILPQFIKLNIITNMCYHGNLSVTRLSQSNICFWSNARSFFLVFDKSTMFSIQTLHANLKCKQSNLTQCGRKQSILLYRDGIWELPFYIGNCISVLCSLMSCNVSTCKVSADFVEKSQRYA